MNIHPLWYLCLFTRLVLIFVLVYMAKHFHNKLWVRLFGASVLAIMGSGFLFKYLTGSNNEKQIAKVFWHETRLLHGVLYIIAAFYYVIRNIRMMTIVLTTDIISSLFYRLLSHQ